MLYRIARLRRRAISLLISRVLVPRLRCRERCAGFEAMTVLFASSGSAIRPVLSERPSQCGACRSRTTPPVIIASIGFADSSHNAHFGRARDPELSALSQVSEFGSMFSNPLSSSADKRHSAASIEPGGLGPTSWPSGSRRGDLFGGRVSTPLRCIARSVVAQAAAPLGQCRAGAALAGPPSFPGVRMC